MAEESAFLDKDVFEGTKEKLGLYLEELPSENGGWGMTTGMQLADGVQDWYGVVSTTRHGDPCLSIHDNIVHTPHGDIHAKHIVHATNGWTSHLLAPMWEKIVPVRGHRTAQRTGTGLDDGWLDTWSFVLYPGVSENQRDYLTQQPLDPSTFGNKPHALMFGGGIEMATTPFFDAWWGSLHENTLPMITPDVNGAFRVVIQGSTTCERTVTVGDSCRLFVPVLPCVFSLSI